ncbi:MAG: DUF2341 domain-containing protein, partial [Bacteroidales bacterium]
MILSQGNIQNSSGSNRDTESIRTSLKRTVHSFYENVKAILLYPKAKLQKVILSLTFLLLGLSLNQIAEAQLYNDYGFRKTITVPQANMSGSSVHTDFPMLVRINADNDLRSVGNFGYVENANGYDIVFSIDGTNILDHEMELYDPVTGEYIAWVRIPSLDPTADFSFYIYFGNPSVSADPSTTDTWSASYEGVWHLHDDFDDATANTIDGTNNNTTNTTGLIGDAQNFNASNQEYIDLGNPANINFGTEDWTISAWVNTSTATSKNNIISNGDDEPGGIRYSLALSET